MAYISCLEYIQQHGHSTNPSVAINYLQLVKLNAGLDCLTRLQIIVGKNVEAGMSPGEHTVQYAEKCAQKRKHC